MALTAADDDFHLGTSEDARGPRPPGSRRRSPSAGCASGPTRSSGTSWASCRAASTSGSPGAEELWQLPYYRTWWHLPIPDGIQATGFELPNGLSYECLEPLTALPGSLRATASRSALDTTFRALHPPHEVGVEPGGHGHLDQFGRVTGELRLNGERLEIDCIEMRDRTWSPRRESRQGAYVSYSYGASVARLRLPPLHPLHARAAAAPRC